MKTLTQQIHDLPMSPDNRERFLNLVERYQTGSQKALDWESIQSPDPLHLPEYESLPQVHASEEAGLLKRLVVLKLNGGLGTSMGCTGPKSTIRVKGGRTFLDLILEQMDWLQHTAPVPLVLMNSFYTHETIRTILNKQKVEFDIQCFQQNQYPRLDVETLSVLDADQWGDQAWYPPGHGDFYACIQQQGLLDHWLAEGREIVFISNADNLGAAVDSRILKYMVEQDVPFLMEMTPKTPADVKGGTLYQKAGRIHLLEIGNVPEKHLEEFRGREKFKVFNTNNIWMNLRHLKKRLEQGPLDLGVIANQKELNGANILQLETAIGAGLENLEGAIGLVVPRTRFAPVKTTADLLCVQSNLYQNHHGHLRLDPERVSDGPPAIQISGPLLDIGEFEKRVPQPLELSHLESLDIVGNILFKGTANLKGRVRLIGENGPLEIQAGASLENCELGH